MVSRDQIGFFVYALVIVAVSLLPGQALANPGSLDKVGHFLAYAIMTAWGLIAFKSRRSSILVILFCLILGVGLEYLQLLVSGRDPSVADGIANFLGVVVGVGIFALWSKIAGAES